MKSFFEDKKLVIISSKTIRLNSLIEINKSIRHEIKSIISRNESLAEYEKKKKVFFFIYQGFLSQTMTTHRTAGEGRGPFFIPLYHFHPLTNIQKFMCNFAREINIPYF